MVSGAISFAPSAIEGTTFNAKPLSKVPPGARVAWCTPIDCAVFVRSHRFIWFAMFTNAVFTDSSVAESTLIGPVPMPSRFLGS
ncbi:hypothetical protein OCAE111667_04000 [Occultella aeris]|uniref:Uncharacterized protein n=1 Tax=Occultella aeris TaxID=2761496 RepID=A0A7M4DDT1_9MICO|nr:hypothetical protein HALOF300_00270 [Occultella aeris]